MQQQFAAMAPSAEHALTRSRLAVESLWLVIIPVGAFPQLISTHLHGLPMSVSIWSSLAFVLVAIALRIVALRYRSDRQQAAAAAAAAAYTAGYHAGRLAEQERVKTAVRTARATLNNRDFS